MECFNNVKTEIRKLCQKCQALSNRLIYISTSESEVISKANNQTACNLIEKIFDTFKGKNDEMMKIVLDSMIMKLYLDKKNVEKVNHNNYIDALSYDERFECEELASVFMEQMKSNAMRMNHKDKGIRFSPKILRLALSLYIHSPVSYQEFKKSSLMIFPSDRTLQRMISNMMMTDGVCPKTY